MKILFICAANVCRSPYAARLMSCFLSELDGSLTISIESAGTRAGFGNALCPDAALLLQARSVSTEAALRHRSRPVDASLIDEADLILTAERTHRGVASALAPRDQTKIFTILEAVHLAAVVDEQRASGSTPADTPESRLARWVSALDAARGLVSMDQGGGRLPLRGKRHKADSGLHYDISDGHNKGRREHRSTLQQVSLAVEHLCRSLAAAM